MTAELLMCIIYVCIYVRELLHVCKALRFLKLVGQGAQVGKVLAHGPGHGQHEPPEACLFNFLGNRESNALFYRRFWLCVLLEMVCRHFFLVV